MIEEIMRDKIISEHQFADYQKCSIFAKIRKCMFHVLLLHKQHRDTKKQRMKYLFNFLAFCSFASCVHSQEAVDTVSVRVQYRVKYNERNMKLRDKDTKKYLLTVFVATFVAYIIPAVVLYLGHFMGIMLTICISLFNLSMALLAWLWAKSVRKEFLLKRQIILNSLVTLLLIGIISLVVTNGAALSLNLIVFVWLGIFNLLPICIQYAIYSFISKRTNSKKERPI